MSSVPSSALPSSSPSSSVLHLAVALDGAGWHPAAWREPVARPRDLLTAGYWTDLVTEAERGLLDFVTIEDALGLQSSHFTEPDGRTDQVRGRLDAVLIAARVAPLTSHIGLLPTVVATHTEPFHISKAIATLDYVSTGRGGVRIQVSARRNEAAHFGRRTVPSFRVEDLESPAVQELTVDLFDEAADYVEAVRRLWDSWEDGAEIRDVATGRFIDREKLHYIDFEGTHFSVKGPSITPRPPQGQPPVGALAHDTVTGAPFRLLGRSADLGFVTPHDTGQARAIVASVRAEQDAAGRAGEPLHLFGDLVVFLDEDPAEAAARKERLDALAGYPYTSDARIFTGTPSQLADLLQEFGEAGLTGFRLRPAVVGHDLPAITRGLVPELQRRGVFRHAYEADTLRGLLGLARPANRYAAASAEPAAAAADAAAGAVTTV
ncbi:FMNH2-dependent monooxygenase [Streptomyces dioscori]|uniref:FMNH2-dependent monooxygenase n=1 Tax=Streptomyces dioscori TaxID=2109333 RepID=A0A2P8Q1T3_9ACTN|nr:LLM class flavin-dependent oxidoreductase [Streptomyces dioscori]PSM40200.1 FMNH2-dependent monooxygenase [Streptomyces dioscori]